MGYNFDKGMGWVVVGFLNEYLGIFGNFDLGYLLKLCLYFLYGDIYVLLLGSDVIG